MSSAPSDAVAVVRNGAEGRELVYLRWGLCRIGLVIRQWGRSSSTPAPRPSPRSRHSAIRSGAAMSHPRRWKRRSRRPYLLEVDQGALFAFAGLWDRWEGAGEIIELCCMITCPANALVSALNSRMPAILDRSDYARWLDPATKADALRELLVPFPSGRMTMQPVGKLPLTG